MSQPYSRNCVIRQPGQLDPELGEFWSGSPWEIFQKHNLSCFERNRVYLNVAGEDFVDISHLTDADSDGDGRAVVAADFNSDGRIDLVVRQAGGRPLLLLENNFPETNNYLKIVIRGRKSNALGIGTRIEATVGLRKIVREVFPADTFHSQSPLIVHLGLGEANRIDRLLLRWPSGTNQELHDLEANRLIVITEGDGQIQTTAPGQAISP